MGVCERCGEKFFISGALLLDGRQYYLLHRVTDEHLHQLETWQGPTTIAKLIAVLNLD
jgi:hypothetical protein